MYNTIPKLKVLYYENKPILVKRLYDTRNISNERLINFFFNESYRYSNFSISKWEKILASYFKWRLEQYIRIILYNAIPKLKILYYENKPILGKLLYDIRNVSHESIIKEKYLENKWFKRQMVPFQKYTIFRKTIFWAQCTGTVNLTSRNEQKVLVSCITSRLAQYIRLILYNSI